MWIDTLAKVIGYDSCDSNWNNNSGKIIMIGDFPLDRYRSLFVFKMDAKEDIKEHYLSNWSE